jgi:hypothetical protein
MSDNNHKAWAKLLVDTMQLEQQTMAILYGRDRDGLTLLHRLAREPDGGMVVQYVINHYRLGRQRALATTASELDVGWVDASHAEKTVGLISRAGRSHGR